MAENALTQYKTQSPADESDDTDDGTTSRQVLTGAAVTETVRVASERAAKTFAKSAVYDRSAYSGEGIAKRQVKDADFSRASKDGTAVRDPYTGKELVKTKKEAKAAYGKDWQKHLAESDHKKPLHQFHEDTKDNPFLTADDQNKIANSEDNMQTVSRKFNNAKRSRSNKDFVGDEEYLKKTGVELSEEGKRRAVAEGRRTERILKHKVALTSAKNAVATGFSAGVEGMKSAGVAALALSGITNIVAVIKGEKTADEAASDIAIDTAKAGAEGFVMSGGLTVVNQALSATPSELIKTLAKSNALSAIATTLTATWDTLSRYANGEIGDRQCLEELGAKGFGMMGGNSGMVLGQILIPIPVIGGLIGSMVGYVLASSFYGSILGAVKEADLAREERIRAEAECAELVALIGQYKAEMEKAVSEYFCDHIAVFTDAFNQMNRAIGLNDIDGFMAGANAITAKVGGTVQFADYAAFDSFMQTDAALRL